MRLGEVIKRIRFEGELTQKEVANIVGCTQVSISRIRRNEQFPTLPLLLKIIKLAKSYNIAVELEELLDLKDEPNEHSRKVRANEAK
jgi:transcriptional regulator with XRE-family HTH domain